MTMLTAESRRVAGRLLMAMFGALILVVLLESTSLGQPSRRNSSGGFRFTLESWQFKAACVVLTFLISGFVAFSLIFPWLLRKSRPVWPLTAYGICLWLICTICFAVALGLFWYDLAGVGVGRTDVLKEHWKRMVLIGAWAFMSLLIRGVFYSNGGRVTATA